ncbi:hypothetical protein N658DRAFT_124996 [Parathielavia hyrcaniae]|uniref:Uncharacterized protein n=1 Tax=Parathielavia hyrcaniae TaxID=113614 RepID=A0AAN6Q9T6_9PEZI|nr:hypothetical protein N658DRAFT_124996 [Parathielavia hyrcaniae]
MGLSGDGDEGVAWGRSWFIEERVSYLWKWDDPVLWVGLSHSTRGTRAELGLCLVWYNLLELNWNGKQWLVLRRNLGRDSGHEQPRVLIRLGRPGVTRLFLLTRNAGPVCPWSVNWWWISRRTWLPASIRVSNGRGDISWHRDASLGRFAINITWWCRSRS